MRNLNRRTFLQSTGAGAALAGASPWALAAAKKRPPNLIVIMADDLSARELGCYGHPKHRTPHLDRLAKSGVRFETCYSAPICHPTRFELMTGQYGHHNGVFQFAGRPGGPKANSPEDDIALRFTFGQMLKKAGYATAHTGKWQLSGAGATLVRECGFDEYCMWAYKHNLPAGVEHKGGYESGTTTSRYWHPSIVKNAKYLPTGPDDYGPDIFTDFLIDFARRHRDEPFFIYYPMALTHAPYYSTPDTTKTPEDKFKNLRENFQSNVEYMDKLIGRIVAALDDMGLRDDTVLFFTGDNGTGGTGDKGKPTELGARVPMIVDCPGTVKPIGRSMELVDLSDIMPTLADFAGAKLPADRPIDGRSYAHYLQGKPGPMRDWIYSYLGGRRILRDKRWLLENDCPTDPGRFFDCGDSRDGAGYKDVTDSKAPEVLAARQRFAEILADKPAPVVKAEEKKAAKKKQADRKGVKEKQNNK